MPAVIPALIPALILEGSAQTVMTGNNSSALGEDKMSDRKSQEPRYRATLWTIILLLSSILISLLYSMMRAR
ncbi:MAG TPA: hypothetical protein VKD91_17410 [Pyrinomonadaceae bacterium]|nr:hypothetical protein [Pyrinomonadaceae bacterium]